MRSLVRFSQKTIKSFRRQPLLHLATISTISVASLILAICLLAYRNFEHLTEQTRPYLSGTIYLKEGLSQVQIDQLKETFRNEKNVKEVSFKSKQAVSKELQVFLGASGQEIIPGSELFPDLIELQFENGTAPATLENLKNKFMKNPLVSDLDFSEDWLHQFTNVRDLLQSLGWILIVALTFGCSFIIANFMGMRHQSRKNEIEIVQLIGAHTSFILGPFLFEGLVEGLLGSGIALFFLYLAYSIFGELVSGQWASLLGISSWTFISFSQIFLVLFLGVTMALTGSLFVFFKTSEQFRK